MADYSESQDWTEFNTAQGATPEEDAWAQSHSQQTEGQTLSPDVQQILEGIQIASNGDIGDFVRANGSMTAESTGNDDMFWRGEENPGRNIQTLNPNMDVKGDNWISKMLAGTKDDTKTVIAASLISGMFGAKSKQQLADAATKNAESAALNAKTNADIAANTIRLRNNAAAGMTGAGIMTSPVKPKFVDVPAQRIRPGA